MTSETSSYSFTDTCQHEIIPRRAKLSKASTSSIENSSLPETSEFSCTCYSTENEIDYQASYSAKKDWRKKIYKCVVDENTEDLKKIISGSQIQEILDKHKNNLLHISCALGRLNSVKILSKNFPKLLQQSNDKQQRPIDVAIKHDQCKIVEWLIERLGIDDLYDQKRRPFIHNAAKNGSNKVLKILLAAINQRQLSLDLKDPQENTAAHLAAKYGHLDCLQTMVEFNCDVTLLNQDGHSPCFVAELNSHTQCVNYLTIVETCIKMSLELVKLNRVLRECKADNEALKTQMEEIVAINNDFIYQRENSVHINFDLMQKQIDNLEYRFMNEIDRLKNENERLRSEKFEFKSKVEDFDFKKEIEKCKKELFKTNKNSNNFLAIDYKRIDNLKNRFEAIKFKNFDNKTFLEDSDHIAILRKMHQETTHKLMIFRNSLKNFNKRHSLSQSSESSSAFSNIEISLLALQIV
ncbi:synphilin-1 isoform X1 [Brachionus plicatilis]|uniref:Synphilin-1 isoform X1 n=1 Tax=Brachionus plicatilis TaxID=10195 RepID=A0A3M7Q9T5_BRAPC|nr:synphilin-1 isoform X1 [Brachionus plicatilis]